MKRRRCRTLGCGRYVSNDRERCKHHPVPAPAEMLVPVMDALQTVLQRVITEMEDLEKQARYVPRLTTAAIQAVRTQHQIGSQTVDGILEMIKSANDAIESAPLLAVSRKDTP